MTGEEKEEQKFFAAKLKEGNKPMAKKKDEDVGERETGDLMDSGGARPDAFVADPHDPRKVTRVGPQVVDMTDFDGDWYKQDEPRGSKPYGRKLVPNDPYNYTVHMKNQEHYWSGTAEQAKAQFSKTKPEDAPGASPHDHDTEPPAV